MLFAEVIDGDLVMYTGDREKIPVGPLRIEGAQFFFIDIGWRLDPLLEKQLLIFLKVFCPQASRQEKGGNY